MRQASDPNFASVCADLDRARAGEDVTTALLEHRHRLDAMPWSSERSAVDRVVALALLASSTRAGVLRAVRDAFPMQLQPRVDVRSVLLRGGDPLSDPIDKGPWGIVAGDTLEQAIARIWQPVAHLAPAFVAELTRRTLGLALLWDDSADRWALGYLVYFELESYLRPTALEDADTPPFDRRHGLRWEAFGDLTMFVGHAPAADLASVKLQPGVTVPRALRALYQVHGGMVDGMWSLYGPEHLMLWSTMLGHTTPARVAAEDDDEVTRSDELLGFFCYGDDRSDLFDLTDDPEDPRIRSWGDGMLYRGANESFWPWFEERTSLLLRIAD